MPKFTALRNVLPNQGIINYTIKSKLLHSQSRGAMRITLECPSVPPVAGLPVSNVYRNMACHEQIIFSCLRKLCVEWRRERDSNPRSAMRTIAFEATAFNRSAISPGKTVQSLKSSVQRKTGLFFQSTLDSRRCTQDFRHYLNRGCARIEIMAEREGFEPSIRLLGKYSLSRRAPSAGSAISPKNQCKVQSVEKTTSHLAPHPIEQELQVSHTILKRQVNLTVLWPSDSLKSRG